MPKMLYFDPIYPKKWECGSSDFLPYHSHGQPAALEALQCGPSKETEKRYFGAKSIRPLEKIQILALKMVIFQKCGPRADLGILKFWDSDDQ
jgi:hypothetical protein